MNGVLMAANTVAALVSAGSSAAGMVRPQLALVAGESVDGGTRLYAQAYAARAVPLGIALALALCLGAGAPVLWPVLAVAGLAQAGDSVIGFRRRNRGMGWGAGAFAVLHLATAAQLLAVTA
jgi:hypothetical protein